MKIQAISATHQLMQKEWIKKLGWALPLFFLVKGLMWLAIPLILTIYRLN
jgi:hypothetical protein